MALAILSTLSACVAVLAVFYTRRANKRTKDIEKVLCRQIARTGDLEARVGAAHRRTLDLHSRIHDIRRPAVIEGPQALRRAVS